MTPLFSSKLEFYFVSYLDILGFSDMVKRDCESPSGSEVYMNKLLETYENTLSQYGRNTGLDIIQFSDSVVLAMPFSKDKFSFFVEIVSSFQYSLFKQGFLCRGGIAYGKHFLKDGFLFSNGLIEAYKVERDVAKYPRVALSTDLIRLIYKEGILNDDIPIIKENDEIYFVDFLANNELGESATYLKSILEVSHSNPSIKEKHRWLTEYFDYKVSKFDSSIPKFGEPRFSK